MLYVLVNGNREGFFVGGELTEVVGKDHLLTWFILDTVIIFLHVE